MAMLDLINFKLKKNKTKNDNKNQKNPTDFGLLLIELNQNKSHCQADQRKITSLKVDRRTNHLPPHFFPYPQNKRHFLQCLGVTFSIKSKFSPQVWKPKIQLTIEGKILPGLYEMMNPPCLKHRALFYLGSHSDIYKHSGYKCSWKNWWIPIAIVSNEKYWY